LASINAGLFPFTRRGISGVRVSVAAAIRNDLMQPTIRRVIAKHRGLVGAKDARCVKAPRGTGVHFSIDGETATVAALVAGGGGVDGDAEVVTHYAMPLVLGMDAVVVSKQKTTGKDKKFTQIWVANLLKGPSAGVHTIAQTTIAVYKGDDGPNGMAAALPDILEELFGTPLHLTRAAGRGGPPIPETERSGGLCSTGIVDPMDPSVVYHPTLFEISGDMKALGGLFARCSPKGSIDVLFNNAPKASGTRSRTAGGDGAGRW
jgi:hypothetical protein